LNGVGQAPSPARTRLWIVGMRATQYVEVPSVVSDQALLTESVEVNHVDPISGTDVGREHDDEQDRNSAEHIEPTPLPCVCIKMGGEIVVSSTASSGTGKSVRLSRS
jgi:hypothetical protein